MSFISFSTIMCLFFLTYCAVEGVYKVLKWWEHFFPDFQKKTSNVFLLSMIFVVVVLFKIGF